MPDKEPIVPQSVAVKRVRPRLVLLEDNESVRRATELFLLLEEFEVTSVGSAAETEQVLNAPRGDEVLIADFHLGGPLTGLDVLRKLRRHTGYEIPAVILSGDLPTVMRTIKDPVPHCLFLGKPVDTRELLQAIAMLGGLR